jgi:hypothetical protein
MGEQNREILDQEMGKDTQGTENRVDEGERE